MQTPLNILRKKRGMTLKELSRLSGVALSTIGNYETGRRGMSDILLKKIASVLHVQAADIGQHQQRKVEKSAVKETTIQGYFTDDELRSAMDRAMKAQDWSAVSDIAAELSRRSHGGSYHDRGSEEDRSDNA